MIEFFIGLGGILLAILLVPFAIFYSVKIMELLEDWDYKRKRRK